MSLSPRARRGATRLLAALTAALSAVVVAMFTAPPALADTYRVEITNNRSGLKADVMWASTADFTGVFLWPDNTSASQEFNLLDSGGGFFRIQARHSGKCLMFDWRQGNANGTPVIQYDYCAAGYAPSEWRRVWISAPPVCSGNICTSTSAAYPLLVNRLTGRCLDAANGSTNPPGVQAVLQQWDCITTPSAWNAGNQIWGIAPPGQREAYL